MHENELNTPIYALFIRLNFIPINSCFTSDYK